MNRRGFFRRGIFELLRPLAQAAEPLADAMEEIASLDDRAPVPRRAISRLRPPGALPEPEFVSKCEGSGRCVESCPVKCISLETLPGGRSVAFIDADRSPCVVCDGLFCMKACPTGALTPVPLVEIDMGTAVWRDWACLRASGEPCVICLEACPLGTQAIDEADGKIIVNPDGCVGCGVCQHQCPTLPKAILVIPASQRRNA